MISLFPFEMFQSRVYLKKMSDLQTYKSCKNITHLLKWLFLCRLNKQDIDGFRVKHSVPSGERYWLQTSAKFMGRSVSSVIKSEAWSNKGQPLTIKLTSVWHGTTYFFQVKQNCDLDVFNFSENIMPVSWRYYTSNITCGPVHACGHRERLEKRPHQHSRCQLTPPHTNAHMKCQLARLIGSGLDIISL